MYSIQWVLIKHCSISKIVWVIITDYRRTFGLGTSIMRYMTKLNGMWQDLLQYHDVYIDGIQNYHGRKQVNSANGDCQTVCRHTHCSP